MVSTYLMYRALCAEICAWCQKAGVPVLIGGPYFSQPQVNAQWADMPGLAGLVAGEVELELPAILQTLINHGDPSQHEGVLAPSADGTLRGTIAAPLQTLDAVPIERVSLNRLQLTAGTALDRAIERAPARFKGVQIRSGPDPMAQIEYRNEVVGSTAHRRAVMSLLGEIHRINSRRLSARAREFEGVM